MRNLRMFRELCDENPLKNVILVTSFWDQVSPETGASREEQLRTNPQFWGKMISKGSRVACFEGRDSALSIVSSLANQRPLALSIQHELVEEKKDLIDTAAGIAVNEELARLEARHKVERAKLQQEFREALDKRDVELQETLREERRKVEEGLERVHRQQQMLKAQRRADQRKFDNDLDQLRSQIGSQADLSKAPDNGFDVPITRSNAYQRAGQQNWDDLEWVVPALRANEIKLNPEERFFVELKIQEAVKETQRGGNLSKSSKKMGNLLLNGLKIALPITTMALLEVPIFLPFGSSGVEADREKGASK